MISYPDDAHQRCRQIEDDSFWFRHRNACLIATMRRLSPAGTVYDVGGGNGFVARALQDAGFDAALIEPGADGAANARALGVRDVICATLETSGLPTGSLAAIGVFDVIEHVEDDDGFVRTLRRYLAPGGRLYATVPAYGVLWSADDVRAGHYRRYTLSGLRALVRRCGFSCDYATYMFSPLPLPMFLLRALPARLGLRKPDDTDRVASEHAGGGGATGRALDRLLSLEARAIARGASIPFGSSILLAASAERA